MTTPLASLSSSLGPRLLAGFSTVALVAAVGLFASSRPAHTAGGPVPVAVSNLPLPTIPTDKAAPSQPVDVQEIATVADGRGSFTLYTVPAGKRLVIERTSATTEFPNDTPNSYSVLVLTSNFEDFYAFPVVPSGALATGSETGHLYADAGTTVTAEVSGRSGTNDQVGVSLSGYLVDEPGAAARLKTAPASPSRHGGVTQE